ncbi:putative zinc-type alcohol dehydrogenase-like protein [Cotonvirus japonicus]|uniref:Zinc-type alcohol dehydrogenase-like protein n=1 Tax=Cotonvirus japonicus TaxID=2811091 RepID=A0ABM7NS97_9VIRU|nr:putative zinc-type alcohol dehydrogenase-like protein [Cotonvirus japonicus]BCS83035.1 putative zinc-type alcohol dehydrogenase-like protein [Cotonvirus japonicus]
MSIQNKQVKYTIKLQNTNDRDKIRIYNDKLKKYNSQINLKKPQLVGTDLLNEYSLKNEYKKNSEKILAFGYGVIAEKHPIELMIFERKKPKNNDVMIEILYTGICHSDWHFIVGEWKTQYPIIPGHELIGRIIDLGENVDKFNINDIVCVAPTIDSCGHCKMCKNKIEQHCENGATEIYGMPERLPGDLRPTGPITYGGYSNIVSIKQHFVYKFPDNLDIRRCAPLMCAGATTFSPLKKYGVGPNMIIGIVGIGGLGHIAVKLAKAMGARVIAITHTEWKVQDAKNNLGADDTILSTDFQQMENNKGIFDFILSTIPVQHDIIPYVQLLKYKGTICIVGNLFPTSINFRNLADYPCYVESSLIAGTQEISEMLNFCSKNNIMPDVEIIDGSEINHTRKNLLESKVRYRYVIDIKSTFKN